MMLSAMESTNAPGKNALRTPAWSPLEPSHPKNVFELSKYSLWINWCNLRIERGLEKKKDNEV